MGHGWHGWSRLLVLLYAATCCLCAMMVGWILIFPASFLVGHSRFHDRTIEHFFASNEVSVPMNLILKYKGHTLVGAVLVGGKPRVLLSRLVPFCSGPAHAHTPCSPLVVFSTISTEPYFSPSPPRSPQGFGLLFRCRCSANGVWIDRDSK